jgi:hypothetical protein
MTSMSMEFFGYREPLLVRITIGESTNVDKRGSSLLPRWKKEEGVPLILVMLQKLLL